MSAVEIAARVRGAPTIEVPWPYSVLDGFLPADVFDELAAALPGLSWDRPEGQNRKARDLPARVADLLLDPLVLEAFAERFAFPGPLKRVQLEAAWFGDRGLPPHCDRKDKMLSAQVYLTGEPKGTELYDSAGKLAGAIEWAPNRLAAWTRPANSEMHAAPKSSGRFVLLYWFMR